MGYPDATSPIQQTEDTRVGGTALTSALTNRSYFDHAATTPLRHEAGRQFQRAATLIGNPAALHASGRAARRVLEDARDQIAGLLGAQPGEVIFTSGGSEADTIAVLGAAAARPERSNVVISSIEHPAVGAAAGVLGPRVRVCPVDGGGHLVVDELGLDEATAVVSVMAVNNEVGTIQPLGNVVAAAQRVGVWVHVDAVQAVGHLDFNFASSGADLASVSGHKVGGPVGIGVLLMRRGVQLPAWGLGGRQEGGLRSGTQMVALAVAFASALQEAVNQRSELRGRLAGFSEQIVASASAVGVHVNGTTPRVASIINLGVSGASAQDVMFLLDRQGIDVSTGSACRAGVHGPSEVLLAMGQDAQAAASAIRISMGWSTTQADVDHLVGVLPAVVAQARRVPR